MPFKTWSVGEVLTASDMNTFVMKRREIAKKTTVTGSTTTTLAAVGMTITFTAEAGVDYEITFQAQCQSSVGGDQMQVRINQGTLSTDTEVAEFKSPPLTVATLNYTITGNAWFTPGAGSVTLSAWFQRTSGTGNVSIQCGTTFPGILAVREF